MAFSPMRISRGYGSWPCRPARKQSFPRPRGLKQSRQNQRAVIEHARRDQGAFHAACLRHLPISSVIQSKRWPSATPKAGPGSIAARGYSHSCGEGRAPLALPDISRLESRPTREFGFDIPKALSQLDWRIPSIVAADANVGEVIPRNCSTLRVFSGKDRSTPSLEPLRSLPEKRFGIGCLRTRKVSPRWRAVRFLVL